MNEATREAVKKHLADKESKLRMLEFEMRQDEISLDKRRTYQEALECEIEDLREDLEEPEEDDDGEAIGPIATAYVDVMPRFDGFIDALKKLNED